MAMRPTHRTELGTGRSTGTGPAAGSERELIAELVQAHQESHALVHALLLCHEQAARRQADADRGVALAADNPADREANARAIEAAALAEAAHLAKMYATDKWSSHVMRVHGLMAMTDELDHSLPAPAPGDSGPTAPVILGLARGRARGDCTGRLR